MQMFLTSLLECSAVMSAISLAYMAATSLLSKRYTAKWLYYIWLVVVIGWVFPLRLHLDTYILPFELPKVQDMQDMQAKYIVFGVMTNAMKEASSIPLWWVIASVWIFGTIGLIVYYAWRHARFLKMVNRWSEDITNQEILGVLDTLRTEMKIGKHVGLKTCSCIASPMMIGFFRSTILLPCNKIASDELTFILRHELVHLKRNDLWYKAVVLLAIAVHWFNPVVYIMAKAITVQCEISCDELLVQETSLEQRKQYGESLIGIVRNGTKLQTALSTNFFREGNFIKTRIFSIMDATKKKSGVTILCITLIAIMGSGMVFASSPAKNKEVINIDVKSLESRKFVCLEGPYTFEEGDVIQYNAPTEGNNKKVTITFVREDAKACDSKGSFQFLTLIGCYNQSPDNRIKVTQSQAGSYCLLIGNDDEGVQNNIKGTIEITKGKESDSHGQGD